LYEVFKRKNTEFMVINFKFFFPAGVLLGV